jgi:amino acid adenylation domain-containing protein
MKLENVEDIYPLSPLQQGMLFHTLYAPQSGAYFVQARCAMEGEINGFAFRRAWQEVVNRHPVLRTAFLSEGLDEPLQVVRRTVELPWEELDWRALPASEQTAKIETFLNADQKRGFDLTRAPLTRVALIRLADQCYELVWSCHHILLDGWSWPLVFKDFMALYEGFAGGQEEVALEPQRPYRDYIAWLQQQDLSKAESYWRSALKGFTAPTPIGGDKLPEDGSVPGEGYRAQSLRLSSARTRSLHDLARRHRLTVNSIIQGAWALLLSRHSGSEDVVFGTTVSGRPAALPGVESMVGLFINTLPLRVRVAAQETLVPWLKKLLEQQVELRQYEHSPLVDVQGWSEVPRGQPLFESIVVFENYPRGAFLPGAGATVDAPGRSLRVKPTGGVSWTNYPLSLVAIPGPELALTIKYERRRFHDSAVARILDQLSHLVDQFIESPDQPIRSYSLVTPQSSLLLPDPARPLPAPRHEPVTAQFASWATRTPERFAICQGDRVWSYAELLDHSQTLAKALIARGLVRGDVVAVHGPRSFGLIASMLGVFFTGGVLLTIDPELPDARKRLMIQEAGARHGLWVGAVASRNDEAFNPELPSLNVLDIDPDSARVGRPEVRSLEGISLADVDPDDPAYVFFTSGTTGVPQGVLGCHKGLSHFLDWQRDTFDVSPDDRCAQLTALSFDVVLRDVFLPLVSGATLILPGENETVPDYILTWLERQRISVLHAVPTLAQAWLAQAPARVSLPALKRLFFAGEPLTDTLVTGWRTVLPEFGSIVNLYGPTETTLAKCFYLVPADIRPGVQPVGMPLPNSQALVFADRERQCGIGEPGEIVIRTPFRTLGYVNPSGDRRSRFARNPFSEDEKDLLYFTGDRGRISWDGSLEILGRLDHQVKIRGVRVEPDEVTAALARHPSVQSCAVVALRNDQGEHSLAAYVVPERPDRVDAGQLHVYLAKQLPSAMIPSSFVIMDRLPLNSNGKIDRAALPLPDTRSGQPSQPSLEPRTPTEKTLAKIWADVLGVDRVGAHDHFFALGGHSLLATQVVSRICDLFPVRVALRSVFETSNLAELAEHIDTLIWAAEARQSGAGGAAGDREEIKL